jgi:hypothetical protein
MITETDFLRVIDALAEATGLEDTTISSRIFDDGKRITAIRNGGTITLRRVNDALRFLSANWPEGVEWPDHIDRPPVETQAQ